jgi:hypothetical protein
MEFDEETLPEDNGIFVGPCTCEHFPSEHGYMTCLIVNCDCEAHWEE